MIRGVCAYCGVRPAGNNDHVIPKAVVKGYYRLAPLDAPMIPAKWLETVRACYQCNIRKGSRRLVPPSWEKRVKKFNDFFGGTPFRVWDGDPMSPAYRDVHP